MAKKRELQKAILKEELEHYMNTFKCEDKKCLGCRHFKWNGAKAGAPENPNWAFCRYHKLSWECGTPKQVYRPIICLIDETKEYENG